MQIKTTTRHHFTPVRMAVINKTTNKCRGRCGEKGTLLDGWQKCKLVPPPQKTVWRFFKNRNYHMIQQPHFWAYIWKSILICKDTCTLMFTAALFIIAETWKQPSCPLTDKWIKDDVVYTYTHTHHGISFSHKKEWNNAICSNLDEPRDYHTKWSKSERERQIYITYMWDLKKMILMSLFAKQKQTDIENKHDYQRKKSREG